MLHLTFWIIYLHNVSVVDLPLPHSCPVAAAFKHWCIVVDVQQTDGHFAVSCLQPTVSQHHQLDLRTQLKVQGVIFLHSDLTCATGYALG